MIWLGILVLVNATVIAYFLLRIRYGRTRRIYNIVFQDDWGLDIVSVLAENPDEAISHFVEMHPDSHVVLITRSWQKAVHKKEGW